MSIIEVLAVLSLASFGTAFYLWVGIVLAEFSDTDHPATVATLWPLWLVVVLPMRAAELVVDNGIAVGRKLRRKFRGY